MDDDVDAGLKALWEALDKRGQDGKEIGNKTELARALGVSKQTISQWRRVPVYPANRVLEIERLIGLKRWRMRSDIYAPPAGSKK
jgi:DNA-binding transcriptional regulator YdaS (Cro superfamily)